MDASIAHFPSAVRGHAEAMIGWARSEEALALEHGALEERAMADGMELMRLLAQAYLDLRALREQRRDDVRDADGNLRRTAEGGQERTRVMIFGPVRTSRTAYRRKGKENLCPQDAELNWAAAQVSAAGAIRLGKRQAEELAVGAAADFDAFYASRRPEPCPAETGLLITCDGSAFPVLPRALRPATAKARAEAKEENGCPDDPADLRKSRKRTAELAAVADIPPAPRVPGDILAALFGPARPGKAEAPRRNPARKRRGKRYSRPSAGPPRTSSRTRSPRRTAAIRAASGPGSPSSTAAATRSRPLPVSPPGAA